MKLLMGSPREAQLETRLPLEVNPGGSETGLRGDAWVLSHIRFNDSKRFVFLFGLRWLKRYEMI